MHKPYSISDQHGQNLYSILDQNSLKTIAFVVQFYPWFNVYFPLFLFMVMYDHELKTKEN